MNPAGFRPQSIFSRWQQLKKKKSPPYRPQAPKTQQALCCVSRAPKTECFWSETIREIQFQSEVKILETMSFNSQSTPVNKFSPVIALQLMMHQWWVLISSRPSAYRTQRTHPLRFLLLNRQIPPNLNQTKSVLLYLQLGQISPREWLPLTAHLVNPACWQTPTTLRRLTSGRRKEWWWWLD